MTSNALKRACAAVLTAALLVGTPGQSFYSALAAQSRASRASSSAPASARAVRPAAADSRALDVGVDALPLDSALDDAYQRTVAGPAPESLSFDPQIDAALTSSSRGPSAERKSRSLRPTELSLSGHLAPLAEGSDRRARPAANDLLAAARFGFAAPLNERAGASSPLVASSREEADRFARSSSAQIAAQSGRRYFSGASMTTPSPRAEGVWHKSAAFPAVLAGVLGTMAFTIWALREAAAWYAFRALDVGTAIYVAPVLSAFDAVSLGGLTLATLAVAWGVREVFFIRRLRRDSARVSDDQFRQAAKAAIDRLNVPPALRERLAELVKPYRGDEPLGLSYGFTARGGIYGQPGLALHPGKLFYWLKHETDHYLRDRVWAPYRSSGGRVSRGWRYFWSELRSHVSETLPVSLMARRLPALERVLRSARYSLDLPGRYELLLLEPKSRGDGWADRSVFEALSAGKASLVKKDPGAMNEAAAGRVASMLAEGQANRDGRYRVIVASGDALKTPASTPLRMALDQLERVRSVADRLKEGETIDSDVAREIKRRVQRGVSHDAAVEEISAELWHQQFERKLSNVDLVKAVGALYRRLQDKGPVILHWDRQTPDAEQIARLLQSWRGEDNGKFEVLRVKTEDGGEAVIAFKSEPRIELWLEARPGHRLDWTSTRLHLGDHPSQQARAALRQAGYSDRQISRFIDEMDMEVEHVFGDRITNRGPPLGMNHIFVTLPRKYKETFKRFAETEGFPVRASQGGIRAHLMQSLPIQKVSFLHRFLGIKGKGLKLDSLDTGVDDTHSDFMMKEDKIGAKAYTNEPPTIDYDKHGTFTFSETVGVRGAAPEAGGIMRKVFSREGGASDGDIMAALTDAYKEGADGINMSLGQDGEVGSPLAVFVSNLVAGQLNSRGERVFIVVSFGNSGPLDMTGGDPATGEHAIAVAAATKSLDDGVPEVAWYSSRGFSIDNRWYVPRLVLKPEITAIGGDVTPGEDMFQFAVEAARSKYGDSSASDTPDGKDTRMAGTSMAAPFITAILGLAKFALTRTLKLGKAAAQYFLEHLPFALKMIVMRSAEDMGVPLVAQGPGLVHSLAFLLLAASTFGGAKDVQRLRQLALKAGAPAEELKAAARLSDGEGGTAWIERIRLLSQSELAIYHAAKEAGDAVKAKVPADANLSRADKERIGNESNAEALKRFGAERDKALPQFRKALADPVWLVRLYAAFYLVNLSSSDAAEDLLRVALNDEDARVRQAAFLALAAASKKSVDDRLKTVASAGRDENGRAYPFDVPLYAAYALLRRAPAPAKRAPGAEVRTVFEPVLKGLTDPDKRVRESAAWVAGQLGKHIPAEVADAVARRISDSKERNQVRHVAVVAMAKIAFVAGDGAVTDEAVLHVLRGTSDDSVLAMDTYQFWAVAAKREELAQRLRGPALAPALRAFVERFKAQPSDSPQGRVARLLGSVLGMTIERSPEGAASSKAFRRFDFNRQSWPSQFK